MKKDIFLLFFCIISFLCYSQTIDELKRQKKNNLKEIELTKSLLSATKSEKEKTLNDLLLIDRKINLRKTLIWQIEKEIENNNYRKDTIDKRIVILENQLQELKEEYSRIIVNSYKRKDENNLIMFVFSSNSFNQAYKRIKYFQQYSGYRKEQKFNIIEKNESLLKQKYLLDSLNHEKESLLIAKIDESTQLKEEHSDYKNVYSNLKSKEQKLRKDFVSQQRLTKKLDDAIAKLIAKEFKKDKEGVDIYKLTPQQAVISEEFTQNKGLLPWPIERGVIIKSFGEHKHPVFKYVKTYNKGIDIATPPTSFVRSVFKGEVKSIINIPGSHIAILIRHGEYLTVYSNLINVDVNIGDIVNTYSPVGTVYTNNTDNKSILHFEIWHENSNLNPTDWIKNN